MTCALQGIDPFFFKFAQLFLDFFTVMWIVVTVSGNKRFFSKPEVLALSSLGCLI